MAADIQAETPFWLQLRTSLTAAALSEDGSWLAVADMFETKLYRLREDVGLDPNVTLLIAD